MAHNRHNLGEILSAGVLSALTLGMVVMKFSQITAVAVDADSRFVRNVELIDHTVPCTDIADIVVSASPYVDKSNMGTGAEENLFDEEADSQIAFEVLDLDAEPVEDTVTTVVEEEIPRFPEFTYDLSDVRVSSGATVEQIQYFCDTHTQFSDLTDYLISLDENLNVFFILAVARAETGGGLYCIGDYNIFNMRNWDGSYTDYASYQDSITSFYNHILKNYVSEGGMWYEGTGVEDIEKHYANPLWGEGVSSLMDEITYLCERNQEKILAAEAELESATATDTDANV